MIIRHDRTGFVFEAVVRGRHVLDYNVETGEIGTVQAYVKRKPDLAALAAEFATTYTPYDVWMCGANYDWSARR